MYNAEIKEEFLQTVSDERKSTYKRIFKFSEELEEHSNKDLCEFKGVEMEKLLHSLQFKTESTAKKYISFINQYHKYMFYRAETLCSVGFLYWRSPEYVKQFVDYRN